MSEKLSGSIVQLADGAARATTVLNWMFMVMAPVARLSVPVAGAVAVDVRVPGSGLVKVTGGKLSPSTGTVMSPVSVSSVPAIVMAWPGGTIGWSRIEAPAPSVSLPSFKVVLNGTIAADAAAGKAVNASTAIDAISPVTVRRDMRLSSFCGGEAGRWGLPLDLSTARAWGRRRLDRRWPKRTDG